MSAAWRDLIVVNYAVDPGVLIPRLPAGTQLDLLRGEALVSVVAFRFLDTRVRGMRIPFHVNFEEINLRFYVTHRERDEDRRGVVFVKELVPRAAIAAVARAVYNENYFAVPMSHSIVERAGERELAYAWHEAGARHEISAKVTGAPGELVPGSDEEFILEHYWGYARTRRGGTVEYQVAHPRWRAWSAESLRVQLDAGKVYGSEFAAALAAPPRSAFVAEGSEVRVYPGSNLHCEAER